MHKSVRIFSLAFTLCFFGLEPSFVVGSIDFAGNLNSEGYAIFFAGHQDKTSNSGTYSFKADPGEMKDLIYLLISKNAALKTRSSKADKKRFVIDVSSNDYLLYEVKFSHDGHQVMSQKKLEEVRENLNLNQLFHLSISPKNVQVRPWIGKRSDAKIFYMPEIVVRKKGDLKRNQKTKDKTSIRMFEFAKKNQRQKVAEKSKNSKIKSYLSRRI